MNTILNPLYIAVSWVIKTIHSLLSPIFGAASGVSWSLAIIGLVILIRIILIPLFVNQTNENDDYNDIFILNLVKTVTE